jgi:uncharacterized membrane protein YfcA
MNAPFGFDPSWLLAALATAASFLAGLVDAIVGGGGLILVPALFSLYPQAAPATLFGSNKAAAVWGTAWATGQYARRVELPWGALLAAAALAAAASMAGAWFLTRVSPQGLRQALPWILLALLAYTWMKKDLGRTHAPSHSGLALAGRAGALGAVVGFYDGFFGPGTGSFLVFGFVRFLGFDFLHASASAKLINTATNLAAVGLFAALGHVWWPLALSMAVGNVLGSLLGTRIALKGGAVLVRRVFLLVVGLLIFKTARDAGWFA